MSPLVPGQAGRSLTCRAQAVSAEILEGRGGLQGSGGRAAGLLCLLMFLAACAGTDPAGLMAEACTGEKNALSLRVPFVFGRHF